VALSLPGLKFKDLEHVLIEKVEQLFRDMLWRARRLVFWVRLGTLARA